MMLFSFVAEAGAKHRNFSDFRIFGESPQREAALLSGEESTDAAVFSTSVKPWPRRDKIKPEKTFNVSLHADTVFVHLSWEKGVEADLKGYRIYRCSEAHPKKIKQLNRRLVTQCSFRDPLPGKKGERFLYAVASVDRAGNESDLEFLTVSIPDRLAPGTPNIEDVSFRNRICFIRWKASPDRDIKGYWLYRSADSALDSTPLNKSLLPANSVLYLDRNCDFGTAYTYWVVAVDSSGLSSGRSNGIRIQIPVGDAMGEVITGLQAGYDSLKRSVNLSFRYKADSSSIKGFIILRSSDRKNYYPVSSVLKSSVFSDTSLEKGAAYSYKVNVLTAEGAVIEGRTVVRIKTD